MKPGVVLSLIICRQYMYLVSMPAAERVRDRMMASQIAPLYSTVKRTNSLAKLTESAKLVIDQLTNTFLNDG